MESTTVVDANSRIIQVAGKLVIKNLVGVMAGFQTGENIESDTFMLGDAPLIIRVYPNGIREEVKGFVSVYLYNPGDAQINVKCQLITDVEKREFGYDVPLTAKGGGNPGRGYSKFLSHAACAEAYKDKDFVVTAKVEMPGKVARIVGGQSGADPKKPRFNVLESVYEKMEDTNFTLIFEGKEVPCHKHILAAASPVLEAMVKNKHREAVECEATMVDISEEAGRAFLRYIYTGKVQEGLLNKLALAFLALGEMYDLQDLKNMAVTELLGGLEKENMVEMISIGEFFRADDLFEAAVRMTKSNMCWLRGQVAILKENCLFFVLCINPKIDMKPWSGGRH